MIARGVLELVRHGDEIVLASDAAHDAPASAAKRQRLSAGVILRMTI